MKRADLDGLDREALIRLAEEQGVSRPRILTRPELVDEILLRRAAKDGDSDASIARGFFGLARDLVARVVERGLHLPDAATKIRSIHLDTPKKPTPPAVLPTLTLAQIYASQGHTSRAIDTLKHVLESEPDHADARDLLRRLEDSSYVPPKDPLPPEEDTSQLRASEAPEAGDEALPDASAEIAVETIADQVVVSNAEAPTVTAASEPVESPSDVPAQEARPADVPPASPASPASPPPPVRAMLNDDPLPPKYDVDECVAIPVDPETLFVYWEVRDAILSLLQRTRGEGVLAIRALVVEPGWHGPRTYVRDHDVHATLGDYFLRGLPAASVVRVAIGYRTPKAFIPIAHSPLLALPRRDPVATLAHKLVRWSPKGSVPVADVGPESAAFLARALRRVGEAHGTVGDLASLLGLPELGRLELPIASTRHDGSSLAGSERHDGSSQAQ